MTQKVFALPEPFAQVMALKRIECILQISKEPSAQVRALACKIRQNAVTP
ncbi:MAG: hypothetical protein LBT88_01695 [Oscillospiraceae bacterium]|nr:hypothetical protein [Oscillospiraceae bacterium]